MMFVAKEACSKLGLLLLISLWSCKTDAPTPEDIEQAALMEAFNHNSKRATVSQDGSSENVESEKIPVAGLDGSNSETQIQDEEQPLKKIDIVFQWDNVAQQYQQLLQDASALQYLQKGFQSLSSPVILSVRWLEDADGMAIGQIALQYEQPILDWLQLQDVADALLQYRSFLGGNYDLRIWSFQLLIEGGKCRIPILNQDSGTRAILSPCLEYLGEKYCLEKSQGDQAMVISSQIRRKLDDCFQ